jgi:epoxyqueuosine reductase
VRAGLDDESTLVRGAAVWALSRLLPPANFQELAQSRAAAEPDPDVRREWDAT